MLVRRILIVEDVALVAMDLELQARDAGWDVMGPASRIAEALALIQHDTPDAALLDVQLGRELVTPVARALRARGVAIVFGSGHKACGMLPPDLQDTPCLDKPFTFADVERALAPMVASKASAA
ncbi:MAG: response regulator [Alphaproteobacteria bacterium]|nr:response regulator [Alphaproteobacteria bacterium]